ncbi:MAG: Uma2 family endonuclease [Verrucomicrobiota bacterium]
MTAAEPTRPKTSPRLWTYAEMVAELPETNQPVELWNGEIIMSPAPHPDHQTIVLNFAAALREFVAASRLGKVFVSPVDVVLTPHRVVQPDVLFITQARRNIVRDHIAGAPDLVMEVISAGSWQRDRIEKKALYEQGGVTEYWIIDPDASTIEVFALIKDVYQLHSKSTGKEAAKSKLLAGFKTTFAELTA